MPRLLAVFALILVAIMGAIALNLSRDPSPRPLTQEPPSRTTPAFEEPDRSPSDQSTSRRNEISPNRLTDLNDSSSPPSNDGRDPMSPPQHTGRILDRSGDGIDGASIAFFASPSDDILFDGDPPKVSEVRTRNGGYFDISLPKLETTPSMRVSVRAEGFVPLEGVELTPSHRPGLETEPLTLSEGYPVNGRVLDDRGSPIVGAQIQRLPNTGDAFVRSRLAQAVHQLATTGPDGRFSTSELPPGPFRLLAKASGFAPDAMRGRTSERGDVTFRLNPGDSIHGTVANAPRGRRLVVNARVHFSDPADPLTGWHEFATVDEGQRFLLGDLPFASTFTLSLFEIDEGLSTRVSEAVSVRSGDRDVVLHYRSGAGLRGRVLDAETGDPITQYSISLTRNKHDDPARVDHHPHGIFERRHLPPGLYSLRIVSLGSEDYVLDELTLVEGEARDLGSILLRPTEVLDVYVIDATDGTPVENAVVTKSSESESEIDELINETQSDRNGHARLPVFTLGSGTITCDHEDYIERVIDVPKGATSVEVALDEGGQVTVIVKDSTGRPESDLSVEAALLIEGEPDTWHREKPNHDGRARFSGLSPGTYRFRLSRRSYSESEFRVGSTQVVIGITSPLDEDESFEDVDVVANQHSEIRLLAPDMCLLRGRVLEGGQPLEFARLRLYDGHDRSNIIGIGTPNCPTTTTDARGDYAFERVRAGDYILHVIHERRFMVHEKTVTLRSADEVHDFDLSVTNVTGRVLLASGEPIVGARVGTVEVRALSLSYPTVLTMDEHGVASFSPPRGIGLSVPTDVNGRFDLRGIRGDVELAVLVRGVHVIPFRSEPFVVPEGQTHDLTLSVHPAGSLDISVVDETTGRPLKNCVIKASCVEGSKAWAPERRPVTGLDGKERLDGLQPGLWHLDIEPLNLDDRSPRHQKRRVEARVLERTSTPIRVPLSRE